jgi:lysophospholipase L1-like esterase
MTKNGTRFGANGALRAIVLNLAAAWAVFMMDVTVVNAADKAWVATWAASPQPTWQGDFPLPTMLPFNLWNQTVRQRVRVSLGGEKFRVVFSNEYGTKPLVIDSVHVALPGEAASAIDPAFDKVLTFGGKEKLVIPPGAPAISDAVALDLPARGDLVVSFFVSGPTPLETFHWDAEQTGFIGAGNQVANPTVADASQTTTRIFLSDVLVEASPDTRTVVAFGDSITDGAASGMDINARWPDFLAENLADKNVSVINAGISGARVLNSRMGENSAARFIRDVASRPNVKTVVLLMGINDISWPGQSFSPDDRFLTREELISGYRQLIALAHAHNIRIVAGTLTPFRNALKGSPLEGYYSDKRDALRQEVNAWIRESGEFDAVVDLDKLLADPSSPLDLKDELQVDHLHLSPMGNKRVADALNLSILFGE